MGENTKKLKVRSMSNFLQVAAFQGHITEGDAEANLHKIIEITELAEKRGVDILTFPESYLHGYFPEKEDALKNAINLQSKTFKNLCKKFSKFNHITLLVGLNELDGGNIYNTVVVIEKGHCIGKYRKAYTYTPYDYYSLGRDFPVFEKKGIKYGIIICLDSVYREPAHIAALKGARIIFCPCFNRVPNDAKMLPSLHRKSHFISRAFDNHCWLVTSDIIWDKNGEVCSGYSGILSSDGELVAQAEPFQETLITYPISLATLHQKKRVRLLGNPELFEIIKETYEKSIKKP
ncbi:MAG: N-carbamoyl-D-amino acid hydrolase [Gammaproteobacteria bacterium]|jgi:predicted amidohydrolase|nr:N-carbamoyl-D-amino acid hydrolase [Gammaproteobacteria bacterium]